MGNCCTKITIDTVHKNSENICEIKPEFHVTITQTQQIHSNITNEIIVEIKQDDQKQDEILDEKQLDKKQLDEIQDETLDEKQLDEKLDEIKQNEKQLDEIKQNEKQDEIPYSFQDIIDDKHISYIELFSKNTNNTIFWGIGIENETYLITNKLRYIDEFKKLKLKRERYSVDYYNSFKKKYFDTIMKQLYLCDNLSFPIYINSHTFEKTDINLQHKTLYDRKSTPNLKFIEPIHNILLKDNEFYKNEYTKSFVFDGDSIEFITQNFYKTTVNNCVKELIDLKIKFITEISPYFKKWMIGDISFPDHNYGFVSFLTTNCNNLSLCNNSTYHINITLPTYLYNGVILDRNTFANQHLNLIKSIQIVEPLIVASYGTPDIFSLINKEYNYSIGSLRCTLSRYISIQTFDTDKPINGKLLLMQRLSDPNMWYNTFEDSPYILNNVIGYDINFNKFKNHGIELRFLDWFPEEYLTDLINFIVLLAQHTISIGYIQYNKNDYNSIIKQCLQKGFTYIMTKDECNVILHDLKLTYVENDMSPFDLLTYILNILYDKYYNGEIVQLMSPNMSKPILVNYNHIAFEKLYSDLFSKPELIIRRELNPLEYRTPIIPSHIPELRKYFNVYVESSPSRCYLDEEYSHYGAIIVDKDYWTRRNYSYIIGIKGIDSKANSTQTLLHFAHCFKKQDGYKEILEQLQDSIFIDYEYMLDNNKRVISFCKQSGKIGCYLALMAYYNKIENIKILPEFNEEYYNNILINLRVKPKILLIGYGTVGKSCKDILDKFNLECTIWTTKNIIDKEMILDHDIFINAISLSKISEPFLTLNDLSSNCKLSIICDISCDLGNPKNSLPIYNSFTTKFNPIIHIDNYPNIQLIAINNLPSLEPKKSSDEFSTILKDYLPHLRYFQYTTNNYTSIMYKSYQQFLENK